MRSFAAALMIAGAAMVCSPARADEGGVSFWLPGLFGSLAAVPQQPGWSLATVFYNTNVSAGGDVALAREFSIRGIPANVFAKASASLHSDAPLGLINATYVFSQPVLGGQASIGLLGFPGANSTSLTGVINGFASTPVGAAPFSRAVNIDSSVTGFGDLYPQASLRWNAGVNNYMTYITGDIPVGTYNSSQLANLGIGHGALDFGLGYTYLNPETGHELSAVLGLTAYNWLNPSTQYQNGADLHLDWAASQFLSKQLLVGVVGYVYREIGCDSGTGDHVGCFQSQVVGLGPQIGYIIPMGEMQGYLNLKGYGEFAAMHRADGWNVWLTFAISPAPPPGKG